RIVFLGMARWFASSAAPARATSNGGDDHSVDTPAGIQEAVEPAGVDVWHWRDVDVIPKQKISAKTDRGRSLLAAGHLDSNKVVQLGVDLTEQVTPVKHQPFAYAANWTSYAMERSIGRPAADLYLVDLASGNRTKIKERVNDRDARVSPGGKYVLFLEND